MKSVCMIFLLLMIDSMWWCVCRFLCLVKVMRCLVSGCRCLVLVLVVLIDLWVYSVVVRLVSSRCLWVGLFLRWGFLVGLGIIV